MDVREMTRLIFSVVIKSVNVDPAEIRKETNYDIVETFLESVTGWGWGGEKRKRNDKNFALRHGNVNPLQKEGKDTILVENKSPLES